MKCAIGRRQRGEQRHHDPQPRLSSARRRDCKPAVLRRVCDGSALDDPSCERNATSGAPLCFAKFSMARSRLRGCATATRLETNMVVKIMPNDKGSPTGKLADAEVHFTDGAMAGLRL